MLTIMLIITLLMLINFSKFSLYSHFVFVSLIYQLLIVLIIYNLSCLTVFMLEIIVMFFMFWLPLEASGSSQHWWAVFSTYMLFILSVFMISAFINYFMGYKYVLLIFTFFLILKLFFSIFLVYSNLNTSKEGAMPKYYLVFYLFSFKGMVLFYGLSVYNNCLEMMFVFNYLFGSGLVFSFMFFMWLMMICVSCYFLFKLDFFSYSVSSLCFSQYLLIFSVFLNLKSFFFCLYMDVVMFIIVYHFLFFNESSNNKFKFQHFSLFMFFLMCHMLGVPPFPSFFIEINFLFIGYSLINNFILKMIYLMGVCLIMVLNFLVFFTNFSKMMVNSSFLLVFDHSMLMSMTALIQVYGFLWVYLLYSPQFLVLT